jgi:hypothetical protein
MKEDFMRKCPIAVLLCRFADMTHVTPRHPDFYWTCFTERGAGTGGAFDYWTSITYGLIDLEGSQVFGWFNMTHTTQERDGLVFPGGRATVAQWAVDAALASGANLAPFPIVVAVVNVPNDHGAAGGGRMVLGYGGETWEPTFVMHELGHCIGLDHSWSANPDQVYGDRWDIMSAMNVWTFRGQYGTPSGPGLNAPNLRRLGAMPPSRIYRPDRGTPVHQVELAALGSPEAPGYLAIEIPPGFLSPGQTTGYMIEARARRGWDLGIPTETVLIHEVRGQTPYLVAPQLVVGASQAFSTPGGEFAVTLKWVNAAAATAGVEVTARAFVEPARCDEIRDAIRGNNAEIAALQAELRQAEPGEKPRLVAEIRALRAQNSELTQEAVGLGCRI